MTEQKEENRNYAELNPASFQFLKERNFTKKEMEILTDSVERSYNGTSWQKGKVYHKVAYQQIVQKFMLACMHIKEADPSETDETINQKKEKFNSDVAKLVDGSPEAEMLEEDSKEGKQVCQLYNKGPNLCRFGLVGNGCDGSHPEACSEFDKKGEMACKTPCKNGKFHRTVCTFLSNKNKKCPNKKCRYYHPPELEKWVEREAEKRVKEAEKKKEEERERTAFLEEKKLLQAENQELQKKLLELEGKVLEVSNRSQQPAPPIQIQQTPQMQSMQQQLNQLTVAISQLQMAQQMPRQMVHQQPQQLIPQNQLMMQQQNWPQGQQRQ